MGPELLAIGMVSSALGGAVSAGGSLMQGQAAGEMGRYKAAVAGINSKIMRQNADYERGIGEHEAQRSGMKSRFEAGRIRATKAASGLEVNSGSNELVQDSQHAIGLHEQRTLRANAARKAFGYETEAGQFETQAKIYEAEGENAETAGKIGAISSILGAASSVSSKWLQGRQLGMFGSDSKAASSIVYSG